MPQRAESGTEGGSAADRLGRSRSVLADREEFLVEHAERVRRRHSSCRGRRRVDHGRKRLRDCRTGGWRIVQRALGSRCRGVLGRGRVGAGRLRTGRRRLRLLRERGVEQRLFPRVVLGLVALRNRIRGAVVGILLVVGIILGGVLGRRGWWIVLLDERTHRVGRLWRRWRRRRLARRRCSEH